MPLDVSHACAQLKIPQEIYLRILVRAVEHTAVDLSELEQAVVHDNIATVQAVSHRLKGDFANLRVDDISATAKALNDSSKGGTYNKIQAGELVQTLIGQIKGLQQQLTTPPGS